MLHLLSVHKPTWCAQSKRQRQVVDTEFLERNKLGAFGFVGFGGVKYPNEVEGCHVYLCTDRLDKTDWLLTITQNSTDFGGSPDTIVGLDPIGDAVGGRGVVLFGGRVLFGDATVRWVVLVGGWDVVLFGGWDVVLFGGWVVLEDGVLFGEEICAVEVGWGNCSLLSLRRKKSPTHNFCCLSKSESSSKWIDLVRYKS